MATPTTQTMIQRPLSTLSGLFVLWKGLLAAITVCSPGPGYDTSTTLLDWPEDTVWLYKFVRWDAIYFTHIAQYGHVFEQEWAFGIGISTMLSRLSKLLFSTSEPSLWQLSVAGLVVSHITSWLSMILVWLIALELATGSETQQRSIAFVAALFYLLSPAGIFLSAPYTESLFACLNLLGYWLFSAARRSHTANSSIKGALQTIGAGCASSLATFVRSNGILSATIFAFDAAAVLLAIFGGDLSTRQILRLLSLGVGGVVIGAGMVIPQYWAYLEYCSNDSGPGLVRTWCSQPVPSIFTFVQSHYWNVGFLRYWTFSNLPLFFLAAPMLFVLIYSSISYLHQGLKGVSSTRDRLKSDSIYLAFPQLILAVLALTSYHVQIITRISSGYPYWLLWLSSSIHASQFSARQTKTIVTWTVLYAIIQGGLYACFLPPA